jgi:CRP-like cAMP-binding protein
MSFRNQLLDSLHQDTLDTLRPSMRTLELSKGDVLLESGEPPAQVIFPTSGLVSLLGTTPEGHSLEVACVSRHGFLGLPGAPGADNWSSVARAVVPGSAVAISVQALNRALHVRPDLQCALLRGAGTLLNEVSRSVLCHRYHSLLDRLCRWLLRASDVVETDRLELTQEDLSQLLGVPRTSVTNVALAIQDAGAIWYRHGRIRILNRSRLERSACSCLALSRATRDEAQQAPA